MPGAGNPQAYNRYSYVLNNPIKFNDPSGHMQVEYYKGGLYSISQMNKLFSTQRSSTTSKTPTVIPKTPKTSTQTSSTPTTSSPTIQIQAVPCFLPTATKEQILVSGTTKTVGTLTNPGNYLRDFHVQGRGPNFFNASGLYADLQGDIGVIGGRNAAVKYYAS